MSLFSRFKTKSRPSGPRACPICSGTATVFDAVDFNRSCLISPGTPFKKSGEKVWYFLCDNCKFCFAPEIFAWKTEVMSNKIYNDRYVDVDPGFVETRPRNNSVALHDWFGGYLDRSIILTTVGAPAG